MRHSPKKIFSFLGKLLALLSASLLTLACLIWFYPKTLLNGFTLNVAKRILEKNQLHIEWKEGSWSGLSKDFFRKKILLHFEDVCIHFPAVAIEGCFPKLHIEGVANFKSFPPTLDSIGPAEIVSSRFRYTEQPVETQTTEEEKGNFSLLSWIFDLKIRSIAVQMPDIRLDLVSRQIQGGLQVEATESETQENYRISLNAKSGLGTLASQLNLTKPLGWDQKQKGNFNAVVRFTESKQSLYLQSNGEVELNQLQAKIYLDSTYPVEGIRRIRTHHCNFKVNRANKLDALSMECPLEATLNIPRAVDFPLTDLLKVVNARLVAQIQKTREQKGKEIQGNLDLTVDTLFPSLKEGAAKASLKLGGNIDEPLDRWEYEIESKVSLTKLQKIVRFLENTRTAIPQPFNSLDGTAELLIMGEKRRNQKDYSFPIHLQTHFSSRRQKLEVLGEGSVSFPSSDFKKTIIDLAIDFKDVQLSLPDLDLTQIPALFPDKRIIHRPLPQVSKERRKKPVSAKNGAPPETESSFELRLRLSNPAAHPIRFLSSLAQDAIPIDIQLNLDPAGYLVGEITIRPVSIPLFRRKTQLKSLQVKLKPNPDDNEVHGELQAIYVDYTISIFVDGLVKRPSVHFASDPPLSEKQVIAVLLFGRSFDALDSDELKSVGSTRAALADGAIGLASMYVLASTPVESIGYDSTTKSFSAKIRLADRTSATIGTDLNHVRTLGVRRKLGSHLDINTYLENPFLTEERSLSTFLEWNWRY